MCDLVLYKGKKIEREKKKRMRSTECSAMSIVQHVERACYYTTFPSFNSTKRDGARKRNGAKDSSSFIPKFFPLAPSVPCSPACDGRWCWSTLHGFKVHTCDRGLCLVEKAPWDGESEMRDRGQEKLRNSMFSLCVPLCWRGDQEECVWLSCYLSEI